jgi:hypothetical protein
LWRFREQGRWQNFVGAAKLDFAGREKRILLVASSRGMVDVRDEEAGKGRRALSYKAREICSKKVILAGPAAWGVQFFRKGRHGSWLLARRTRIQSV